MNYCAIRMRTSQIHYACTKAEEVCDFQEEYQKIKHTCKYYDAKTFPGDACFCKGARQDVKERIKKALNE